MSEEATILKSSVVAKSSTMMLREHIQILMEGGSKQILSRFDPVEATVGYSEASLYWRYAFGPYEECLAKDPHLQAAVAVRASSALVRKHALLPADVDDPRSVEIQQFIKDVFADIGVDDQEAGFEANMYEALYRGLALGINVQELIYKEKIWHGKPMWFIRRLTSHHPSNFLFDSSRNLRIKENDSDFTGKVAPPNKFFVFRPYADYGNVFGYPLVRTVFLASTLKRFLMLLLANYVEGFAQPRPIVTVPEDISDVELEALKALAEQYSNVAGATVPVGTLFDLKSPAAVSPEIYSLALHMLNAEISKGILGQTLTMDAGGSGSYALANVHMRVREDLVQRDVEVLQSFYNRVVIPTILRINFPDWESLPAPTLYVYPEIDRLAEIKIDAALAQIMPVPQSYLRAKYNIPEVQANEPVAQPPLSVSL